MAWGEKHRICKQQKVNIIGKSIPCTYRKKLKINIAIALCSESNYFTALNLGSQIRGKWLLQVIRWCIQTLRHVHRDLFTHFGFFIFLFHLLLLEKKMLLYQDRDGRASMELQSTSSTYPEAAHVLDGSPCGAFGRCMWEWSWTPPCVLEKARSALSWNESLCPDLCPLWSKLVKRYFFSL